MIVAYVLLALLAVLYAAVLILQIKAARRAALVKPVQPVELTKTVSTEDLVKLSARLDKLEVGYGGLVIQRLKATNADAHGVNSNSAA